MEEKEIQVVTSYPEERGIARCFECFRGKTRERTGVQYWVAAIQWLPNTHQVTKSPSFRAKTTENFYASLGTRRHLMTVEFEVQTTARETEFASRPRDIAIVLAQRFGNQATLDFGNGIRQSEIVHLHGERSD